MDVEKLQEVLKKHQLWLVGDPKGERADLQWADLRRADLDFSSGIPFHCGGTNIKGDRRLLAQMVYHLTRQEWEDCDLKKWVGSIPKEVVNAFCAYRNDLTKL